MRFEKAPDIQIIAENILAVLNQEFSYIKNSRIFYVRSYGSTANAYARIWSLPKIWQLSLEINAYYIIEVISENFDKLDFEEKERTIIHELMHIPMNFSGALIPHKTPYKKINEREVSKLYKKYKQRLGLN